MDYQTNLENYKKPLIQKGNILQHKVCGKCVALSDEVSGINTIKVRFADKSIEEMFAWEFECNTSPQLGIYRFPGNFYFNTRKTNKTSENRVKIEGEDLYSPLPRKVI